MRATHLANHVALMRDFPRDEFYKFTDDHTWWRHCMMIWTVPTAKTLQPDAYNKWLLKAKAELEAIAPAPRVEASLLSQVITDAARVLLEAAERMVKARYKDLVKQAVRRLIILEMRRGTLTLSAKERGQLQHWAVLEFYGIENKQEVGIPASLLGELRQKILHWKTPFDDLFLYHARVGPLQENLKRSRQKLKETYPHTTGKAFKKLVDADPESNQLRTDITTLWRKRQSAMLAFQISMHQRRGDDLSAMQQLDAATVGRKLHKDTEKAFRTACKPGLLLPLSSYEVKSIRLDRQALEELVSSMPKEQRSVQKPRTARKRQHDETNEEETERPKKRRKGAYQTPQTRWEESLAEFTLYTKTFPGLSKLLKKNRGNRDAPKWFGGSLTTNGVSASILMCSERGVRPSDDDDSLGEDAMPKKKPATVPRATPFLSEGKRLVAIDPGMRDIVTAVALEEDSAQAGGTVMKQSLSVSYRQYSRGSHRQKTQVLTTKAQKAIFLDEQSLRRYLARLELLEASSVVQRSSASVPQRVRLSDYLRISPTKDVDAESWSTYLLYCLPVVQQRMEAFRDLAIRKAKFETRRRTDAFLDRVCRDIISLGLPRAEEAKRKPRGEDVLVAFGDANTSVGGFGYGSAPQGRLKHRLSAVHGCTVFPVDEYFTSQKCSSCEKKLVYVGIRTADEQLATERRIKTHCLRPPMYGVLKCLHCKSEGASPATNPKKHWHRDVNAAINIGKAFIFAARCSGGRPAYLRPESE